MDQTSSLLYSLLLTHCWVIFLTELSLSSVFQICEMCTWGLCLLLLRSCGCSHIFHHAPFGTRPDVPQILNISWSAVFWSSILLFFRWLLVTLLCVLHLHYFICVDPKTTPQLAPRGHASRWVYLTRRNYWTKKLLTSVSIWWFLNARKSSWSVENISVLGQCILSLVEVGRKTLEIILPFFTVVPPGATGVVGSLPLQLHRARWPCLSGWTQM